MNSIDEFFAAAQSSLPAMTTLAWCQRFLARAAEQHDDGDAIELVDDISSIVRRTSLSYLDRLSLICDRLGRVPDHIKRLTIGIS
jgi:hypothetical protein